MDAKRPERNRAATKTAERGARSAVVPAELEGPLDRAVRGLLGASWGTARAWIAAGKISVAGGVSRTATARVRAGDELTFDERARRSSAADLPSDAVVHIDAHVIVVNKPAGVSTVPYAGDPASPSPKTSSSVRPAARRGRPDEDEADTLDARVRSWLGRHGLASRGVRPNLGVVHRLDKDTSGLLVFTRTWLAKQSLALQFRKHTVGRKYLAIAHGDVRSHTIRSFLVEDRGDGLRGSTRGHPLSRGPRTGRGRPAPEGHSREAVTHVERIESLRGATLVACNLETGRTHQIRIHLSEAGHPILGERVYMRGWLGTAITAPRLMLHAAEIGFVHPASQREVKWQQSMPDDMRETLERLRSAPL